MRPNIYPRKPKWRLYNTYLGNVYIRAASEREALNIKFPNETAIFIQIGAQYGNQYYITSKIKIGSENGAYWYICLA